MSGYSVKRSITIDERKAGSIVESKHPEYKASSAMKLGEGFVVSMSGKNGEKLYDCMYMVSSDGSKVAEFNPEMCMEAFQKALPNAVKL